ncbi:MAG: 2-aminobenzoate-CoA ligase, partial [Pseudolabrys sp.]
VGGADAGRGLMDRAFIVLSPGVAGDAALTQALLDTVRNTIAPYKYPRAIEYRAALPRTVTGKIQRNALRAEG